MITVDRHGRAWSDFTQRKQPIAEMILDHPRAMVVVANPLTLLLRLHKIYKNDPRWNFRITPVKRERLRRDQSTASYMDNLVNYFGFQGRSGNSKRVKSRRYFYPICPTQFCRDSIANIIRTKDAEAVKLYIWGKQVRKFVVDNRLRFSPTAGGLAAQLLRDERFYPKPRRKVPTATNEKVRQALPGNHYELRAHTDRIYAGAFYIDQHNAHHHAAQTISVPQSNKLMAGGHFQELDGRKWIEPHTEDFDKIVNEYGLLYCNISVPTHIAGSRYVPPALYRSGENNVFIFTNELQDLLSLRVQINWISAAWTSPEADTGLKDYSKWAQAQIKRNPDCKPWLKPTLLASYGILASRPRRLEIAYLRAEKGEPKHLYIGSERLTLMSKSTRKARQSNIANVIQRGMIEAETRKLSLQLARQLEKEGHEVLSVYADGILVRDSAQNSAPVALPLLPEPWRVKERLSGVHFIDPQSFESDLLTKMPGRRKAVIMGD